MPPRVCLAIWNMKAKIRRVPETQVAVGRTLAAAHPMDRMKGRDYTSLPELPGGTSMTTRHNVGYFIGSLSSTSINRRLSTALIRLAPPELTMTEISFRDLPLYSQDYDADYPPVARDFKQSISKVDAILFVTPEF